VSSSDPSKTDSQGQPAPGPAGQDSADPSQRTAAEASAAQSQDVGESSGEDRPASENLDHTLEELREEVATHQDRLLRVTAELENYRRRARRELQDQLQFASAPLLRDLLPVVDNIDRALEAADKAADAASLLAGIQMVRKQFSDVLSRHQCVPIEALHAPFNPNLHEAVSQVPSAEHPPNTVLAVAQSGYMLHDRVLRPSQVVLTIPLDEESR
jgi:molecular chaperone GrpE